MRPALAITALAALVVAIGCGGEEGPSREEYAEGADRICADIIRTNEVLARLRPDGIAEVVGVIDRLEGTFARGIARVRELPRPAGDEDRRTADAFAGAFEREYRDGVLRALRSMRSATRRRDVPALRRAVARLQRVDHTRSEDLARRLGARACAS